MTIMPEEKALLTTGANYWSTHGVPDLQLPSIRVSDGPHGLRVQDDDNPDHLGLGRSLPATCFPPAVTLASSWDPRLIRSVGMALGREARSHGVDVVLGPGIEIKRSPLCGRNFEYYSEDPLLTGRLAGAMVEGLQSQGVGACVKTLRLQHPGDRPAARQRRSRRTQPAGDLSARLRAHHPGVEPLGSHECLQPHQRRLRQRKPLAAHRGAARRVGVRRCRALRLGRRARSRGGGRTSPASGLVKPRMSSVVVDFRPRWVRARPRSHRG
jgi:hypothetical protein